MCVIVKNSNEAPSRAHCIYFSIRHPTRLNLKVKDIGHVYPDYIPTIWREGYEGGGQQVSEVFASEHQEEMEYVAEHDEPIEYFTCHAGY
jgi:hypothetical protein